MCCLERVSSDDREKGVVGSFSCEEQPTCESRNHGEGKLCFLSLMFREDVHTTLGSLRRSQSLAV